MRHRKDVQVVRHLGEVIMTTRANFSKIFTHLNMWEARALGETLIAATVDEEETISKRFPISGDWAEIAPGVRVRLYDAPNEEDMEHYDPRGIVILQVERR